MVFFPNQGTNDRSNWSWGDAVCRCVCCSNGMGSCEPSRHHPFQERPFHAADLSTSVVMVSGFISGNPSRPFLQAFSKNVNIGLNSPRNVSPVSFPNIRCIGKQRSRDCALADSPVSKNTAIVDRENGSMVVDFQPTHHMAISLVGVSLAPSTLCAIWSSHSVPILVSPW